MTIGVVTAIFDNYDRLQPMRLQNVDEAVCVTDNPELKGEGWTIKVVSRPPGETGRMACKHPKLFPWAYCFKAHDYFLTLDGAFDPKNVKINVNRLLPAAEYLCQWRNHYRSCAYQESLVSRTIDKYQDDRLEEQFSFYQSEGFPKEYGLWSNGLILRRDCQWVREFEVQWYREILRWGVQDQISHAYVAWKTGLRPYTPDQGEVVENELATWRGHRV